MAARPAAAVPPTALWAANLGGALALLAGLGSYLLVAGPRTAAFVAAQADRPDALVHRPAADAAWATAGLALALAAGVGGWFVLRTSLRAGVYRVAGIVGAAWWTCAAVLVVASGPVVLGVWADVVVGVVSPYGG